MQKKKILAKFTNKSIEGYVVTTAEKKMIHKLGVRARNKQINL